MTEKRQFIPPGQRHQNAGLSLKVDTVDALRQEAARHGLYPSAAAQLIIDAAIRDNTLASILEWQNKDVKK